MRIKGEVLFYDRVFQKNPAVNIVGNIVASKSCFFMEYYKEQCFRVFSMI